MPRFDDEASSDIDAHAVTVEWRPTSRLTVKSITSYREWESLALDLDLRAPADGSLCRSPNPGDHDFATGSCDNPAPPGTLVPLVAFGQTAGGRLSRQEQWTQELQLLGSAFDGRLRYRSGLYYFDEEAFQRPCLFVLLSGRTCPCGGSAESTLR